MPMPCSFRGWKPFLSWSQVHHRTTGCNIDVPGIMFCSEHCAINFAAPAHPRPARGCAAARSSTSLQAATRNTPLEPPFGIREQRLASQCDVGRPYTRCLPKQLSNILSNSTKLSVNSAVSRASRLVYARTTAAYAWKFHDSREDVIPALRNYHVLAAGVWLKRPVTTTIPRSF